IASRWAAAVARLTPETTLVVNADDPSLAEITREIAAPRVTFGLNETGHQLKTLPHAADSAVCRRCGADLEYRALYVSHLGEWRCPRCSATRPPLDHAGSSVALNGVDSLAIAVSHHGVSLPLKVGVPGL